MTTVIMMEQLCSICDIIQYVQMALFHFNDPSLPLTAKNIYSIKTKYKNIALSISNQGLDLTHAISD